MNGTGETADEDRVQTSTTGSAALRASVAHEKVVNATIQLKQLELLAAEIEEQANRLSADAVTAADAAQNSLDVAQHDAQVHPSSVTYE